MIHRTEWKKIKPFKNVDFGVVGYLPSSILFNSNFQSQNIRSRTTVVSRGFCRFHQDWKYT